jgi:predicted AAA+ superfamily ATPase
LRVGGFPEPFLLDSEQDAARWRRSHLDRILREDLLDLEQVRSIKELDQLVDLLARRVGSTVSFESLARDLAVSPHTVKRWILILESLFVIFLVTPYTKRVARGLRKQPKIYFFDTGVVRGDESARLENTVATALLKHCHFLEDTRGERWSLHFVRDREKREVDFCLVQEDAVSQLVEVKMAEVEVKALRHFAALLAPRDGAFLVVKDLSRDLTIDTIEVRRASEWLSRLAA